MMQICLKCLADRLSAFFLSLNYIFKIVWSPKSAEISEINQNKATCLGFQLTNLLYIQFFLLYKQSFFTIKMLEMVWVLGKSTLYQDLPYKRLLYKRSVVYQVRSYFQSSKAKWNNQALRFSWFRQWKKALWPVSGPQDRRCAAGPSWHQMEEATAMKTIMPPLLSLAR